MTVEFVEKNTSIRFARTYFMNALSQHYMQGLTFYDSDEALILNEFGRAHEISARILLNAYIALILTFTSITDFFLKGEIKSEQDLHSHAFSTFSKIFTSRVGGGFDIK